MAIYKLDVEKKFGQLQFRLYEQGKAPGDFGNRETEMKAFIGHLDEALGALDFKSGADTVIFRGIEYGRRDDVRETVRLSRF